MKAQIVFIMVDKFLCADLEKKVGQFTWELHKEIREIPIF